MVGYITNSPAMQQGVAPREVSSTANLGRLCTRMASLNNYLRETIASKIAEDGGQSEIAGNSPPAGGALPHLIAFLEREINEAHQHIEFISARL